MSNQINLEITTMGTIIRDILVNEPNTNILTDTLESKLLNQDNIITNKILQLRPDSDYKNSNVDKNFVGLGNVSNDLQVKYSEKATILQATSGTNDEKWMTPKKTKEAIEQINSESNNSNITKLDRLNNIWLYSGF